LRKKHLKKRHIFTISIIIVIFIALPNITGQFVNVGKSSWPLSSTNPPDELWNNTFTDFGGWGRCVQEVNDNGYIIAGSCGIGYWWDAFLLMVDQYGNEIWHRTFGNDGSSSSIDSGWWAEITNDACLILVGGRDQPNSRTSHDIWLIKTDFNGNMLWNKTYPGGIDDEGSCVKQTADGGFIITGWYNDKLCLLKTDENGNELWKKVYGDYYSRGYSVVQTSDDGYIVTGSYRLDPEYLWVIKTDSDGNIEWDKKFRRDCDPGNCYYNCGKRVQQTIDDGYIIGGYTDSYGTDRTDYWLIKLNISGVEEWNQTFGGTDWDWGYSAIQTTDGGYIIAGSINWPEKFWLYRLDGYGNKLWEKEYLSHIPAICYCLQQTNDNSYIASGAVDRFSAPITFIIKIEPDYMNNPPNAPTISGPESGKIGESIEYYFSCSDFDNEGVVYYVSWGDGSPMELVYPSGPSSNDAAASHIWEETGLYNISARSRDEYGAFSLCSDPYPVSMPRARLFSSSVSFSFLNLRRFAFPFFRVIFNDKLWS